jgi:uncharacterized cupin superfamily protein
VWVLDGELTLITDAGEEILRAGDCAAFRSGDPDGHHLVNKSDSPARVLEIGTSDPAGPVSLLIRWHNRSPATKPLPKCKAFF